MKRRQAILSAAAAAFVPSWALAQERLRRIGWLATAIVMATGSDPVAAGFVGALSRPGGNVTGLSGFFEATPIKMLELAGALVPRGARVAVLIEARTMFAQDKYRRSAEETGRAVGVRPEVIEVASVEEISRAFASMSGNRPAAVVVMPGPTLFFLAREIPESAAMRRRSPTVTAARRAMST